MQKVRVLNIEIDNHSFTEFVEGLQEGVVVTPNIDHLMQLQKDREFYDCYRQSEHIVCDSRIIQLVSKLLYPGRGVKEQIAGSDLLPAYCQYHKDNIEHVRVFLLGGTEDSVQMARTSINHAASNEIVSGAYSPPFGFENDPDECEKIIEMINANNATALAVGVGAPKQEKWIHRHKDKMPGIRLFFAVGATIDFQAGTAKRAPRWVTRIGFEWLYRMMQEPRRMIRRYLVDDMPFFWLMLKQRLGVYKNPWG